MPVRSRIKILLAERNLERIRKGEKPLSVRSLAESTGITHSALVKLVNGKSVMINFETLDKLMQFFGTHSLDSLLEYIPPETHTAPSTPPSTYTPSGERRLPYGNPDDPEPEFRKRREAERLWESYRSQPPEETP